ncbi:hypothetical protein JDV02_002280 [Purpureocillium takamizusanense]|uniref:Uncharacterized protein n=1 Tax=Purpureocillium takamizusanense TaxID=2060973 RepID=A0A9Q8QAR0_9HYPO|nr:uncharacterized protein JDV02_002280 [Purpureocillium takamizusanense]UNI15778.1 hypothetical protein JDV02_002280 [Purpureocillium takamizusanense]
MVPRIGRADQPSFAVDVIPVDWLVSNLVALTSRRDETLAHIDASTLHTAPQIYHVRNPRPLRLEDLPQMIADMCPGQQQQQQQGAAAAGLVPLEQWLGSVETAAEGEDAAGQLARSAVIKQMLSTGTAMFSLDNAKTMDLLETLNPGGVVEACPGVDAAFLDGLWRRM